jgi:hypothetical protein
LSELNGPSPASKLKTIRRQRDARLVYTSPHPSRYGPSRCHLSAGTCHAARRCAALPGTTCVVIVRTCRD